MPNIFNSDSIRTFLNINQSKTIVFTNGCFDILHPGHLHYLNEAKELGDVLIIGLNSDASVKKLKGPRRPINDEIFRATMLLGLQSVDAVVIFDEDTPINIISIIKPAIHVKGGDYNIKELPEYSVVKEHGGRVQCLSFIEGYSSTDIINKLANN